MREYGEQTVIAWWWRHRGSLLVAWANFLVGAAVAAVAALLGLIVNDVLPVGGMPKLSAWRFAAFGATLVALFAAVWWRGSVHRRTGTLFYVRILDDPMPDWHAEPLLVARRRRMSLRSVTRWVDLPARTTAGIIDLAGPCAEVAAALETVINGDRDDTAYTEHAVAVRARRRRRTAAGRGPAATGTGRATADQTVRRASRPVPRGGGDRLHPAQAQRRLDPDRHGRPRPHRFATCRAGRAVAGVHRCRAPGSMDPVTAFKDRGVSEYHRLRPAGVNTDLRELTNAQWSADRLTEFAAALPGAVAHVKTQAGARELVVAAALPKSLAMALGWGLAQSDCRFFTGTHLLHYDLPAGTFVPIRVHPSQPTLPPLPEEG